MAEIKKTATVKAAVKTEAVKPVAPVPASTAVAAAVKVPEKKAEVKVETKAAEKAPAKKPAEKKTAAKKVAVKKTTEKEPVAKKATKKAVKQVINLQFAGKAYSMEDLVKIAGDVWKYDLHKNDEAYESLELYVKPEESVAYYVFNGDITGSFFI